MAAPDPIEVAWIACNPGVPLPATLERRGGRSYGEIEVPDSEPAVRQSRKGVTYSVYVRGRRAA